MTSTARNASGGIPFNVTLHGWPVPQPPPPQPELKVVTSESEIARVNGTKINGLNATGFISVEDEAVEQELTDMQTLVLAALGTLSILVLAVGLILALRLVWHRYAPGKDKFDGGLGRDESSDPARHLVPQLKTSESQMTAGSSEGAPSPNVVTPKSNGSVITMTLKNNHLIVETEETDCVSPNTKVDSRGSTTTYITNSTINDTPNDEITAHGVQVHSNPGENEERTLLRNSQTGLSQSDLSVSSSGSQNMSYRYGNQTGYDSGHFGYANVNIEPPVRLNNGVDHGSSVSHCRRAPMDRADSVVSANDVTVFLSSDIMARKVALEKQRLAEEDHSAESLENIQPANGGIATSEATAPVTS